MDHLFQSHLRSWAKLAWSCFLKHVKLRTIFEAPKSCCCFHVTRLLSFYQFKLRYLNSNMDILIGPAQVWSLNKKHVVTFCTHTGTLATTNCTCACIYLRNPPFVNMSFLTKYFAKIGSFQSRVMY